MYIFIKYSRWALVPGLNDDEIVSLRNVILKKVKHFIQSSKLGVHPGVAP